MTKLCRNSYITKFKQLYENIISYFNSQVFIWILKYSVSVLRLGGLTL